MSQCDCRFQASIFKFDRPIHRGKPRRNGRACGPQYLRSAVRLDLRPVGCLVQCAVERTTFAHYPATCGFLAVRELCRKRLAFSHKRHASAWRFASRMIARVGNSLPSSCKEFPPTAIILITVFDFACVTIIKALSICIASFNFAKNEWKLFSKATAGFQWN
jgi:hypothetical protein